MELKLEECHKNHWLAILEIRNNDNAGFVKQKIITKEKHFEYMEKHFTNYRVCTFNNEFVGFVGIINNDIRIGVKNEFKRKGVGKFMITEFEKIFKITEAKVKIENIASLKLFEACGFKKTFFILTKNET